MREFSRVEAYIPVGIRAVSETERDRIKARLSGDITFITTKPAEEPVDRALAEWLKIINQKLDFLISLITMEQQGFSSLPLNKVDISGGGMSFFSDYAYEPGDILELKMVIENPAPLALYVYGEVISCESINNEFRIGVKFINIDEDVRDQIVKFVFHRQRQILRQKKEL
ncbi:MAG: PilZ domain-containing protein [Thermodesulfovibrio sp.]|nr:PilZ domain-containing protein [Thermodesulfovibrio sp.]